MNSNCGKFLFQCGFFNRNRPRDHSMERQPLRNGYHGDEHLWALSGPWNGPSPHQTSTPKPTYHFLTFIDISRRLCIEIICCCARELLRDCLWHVVENNGACSTTLCVVRSSAVTNQNEAEWNLMFDFELYSVPCKIICYLTLLFIINFKTFYKQATILSLLVTKLLLHFLLVGELVKTNGVTERVEESAEAAKMCF